MIQSEEIKLEIKEDANQEVKEIQENKILKLDVLLKK